jgi:hypothetical protein
MTKLMNSNTTSWVAGMAGLCGLVAFDTRAAEDSLRLRLQPNGERIELRWPAAVQDANGAMQRPLYELQQSMDLVHWQSTGQAYRGKAGETELSVAMPRTVTPVYYRLAGRASGGFTGTGGAEVFGYTAQLGEALGRIGALTPEAFQEQYGWPAGHYLEDLTWDPAQSVNWTDYMPVAGQETAYGDSISYPGGPNIVNFRLNPAESEVLHKIGFVASERLGSYSFPEAFYQVFIKDRPVFVSTDAILQAWHRTYQDMLEELEEVFLAPTLDAILKGMAGGVAPLWKQYGQSDLKDSLLDADYFLAVARSLLAGEPTGSALNQEDRVAQALQAVAGQVMKSFPLFGEERVVDFSQFQVRGHYDHSERLQRYFKAMMWCGRIDLRLTTAEPLNSPSLTESLRELGTAVVLRQLLVQAGQLEHWQQSDQVVQAFVGWTDSMTFDQLGGLLAGAGIQSLADLPDQAALRRFQAAIATGEVGVQNILSDYYAFPLGPVQGRLPLSFTVCGQKFVLDSWALGQTVYPYVVWPAEDGPTNVMRRVPSCLDAAFAVLGNRDVVPNLVARFTDAGGRKFRYNLPYQHQLAALGEVIDGQTAASWEGNMYVGWKGCWWRPSITVRTGGFMPDPCSAITSLKSPRTSG